MSLLKIALLQITASGWDQQANLEKGLEACRQARQMGADIALFPEMWNIGYHFFERKIPGSLREWQKQAIHQKSPFIDQFREEARRLELAIALTYLEQWPAKPRNTISLIDRQGEIILTYAKVHTCDFDVEFELTPGDHYEVATLDTSNGPVQVGAMICYDREFPEPARILMLQGAEIILVPNACEMEENRTGQLRARAMENMVGVALANYPGPGNEGHSVAFHPMAFSPGGQSQNTLVIQAGEQEGIFLAAFDLELLREWRRKEAWGDAFRKPVTYSALTVDEPRPIFQRRNSRRQ